MGMPEVDMLRSSSRTPMTPPSRKIIREFAEITPSLTSFSTLAGDTDQVPNAVDWLRSTHWTVSQLLGGPKTCQSARSVLSSLFRIRMGND